VRAHSKHRTTMGLYDDATGWLSPHWAALVIMIGAFLNSDCACAHVLCDHSFFSLC